MSLKPKENKIMGNQATQFNKQDSKVNEALLRSPEVNSPAPLQKEGDPENVFGIKTLNGFKQ